MDYFFYNLPKTIASFYKKQNLVLQIIFVILTFIIARTGLDWFYYQSTRGATLQALFWPAVFLGFLVPIFLMIFIFICGKIKKNQRLLNAFYAIGQAGLLGLTTSTFYKIFTGRMGPPHFLTSTNTSEMFRFGFMRGGSFQGWPSSHTSVAFAMSFALITLFPENKIIRYSAIIYALYIGLGVSVNIHWFSDFVAGAILGTIIGISVGKNFLERYKRA